MADINGIFIPKRIRAMLRRIYKDRVTVICAPDGTGKTTLLREFTGRTRPKGATIRYITSAESTADCFSQICMHITGKAYREPVSDKEYTFLKQQFAASNPDRQLILIVDCDYAGETLLGNRRTAHLLSECGCAHFVFLTSYLNPYHRNLAHQLKFTLRERESIAMTSDEVAEYARRCNLNVNIAEAYEACQGSFLGTRLCFMMAHNGQNLTNLSTSDMLLRVVLEHQTVQTLGALTIASAFGGAPAAFCEELSLFTPIVDFFGIELLSPSAIFDELVKLRSTIPLLDINVRRRTVSMHPVLMNAINRIFRTFPDNVRHDMRICYGREFRRSGMDFYAFCEFYLAGEYELTSEIYNNEHMTYTIMVQRSGMLKSYVMECPLGCKPAIPRVLRTCAMLMHTELRPAVEDRFSEVIAYISDSPDYTRTERRTLLSYAYALRASEDMYALDKMGANIMRAYELFRGRLEYKPPMFAWTMYAPTVFFLIHRRGRSIRTETAQFTRYQHMYTEMLDHGRYTEIIFSGEAKYAQGDLPGALELLSAAASLCSGTNRIATRLTAIYCAAKCCLYLGDHIKFFEYVNDVLRIERANSGREEGSCARLMVGLLRMLRGGGLEDTWYALCAEDSDPIVNRFTAPYYAMVRAQYLVRTEKNSVLADNISMLLQTAVDSGNAAAGIKLRLIAAQSMMSTGSYEPAIQYVKEALNAATEDGLVSVPAEYHALYPALINQMQPLVGEELQPFIENVIELGNQFRRGIETVRSYEMTYLSGSGESSCAGQYLVPLQRLMSSTDGLRQELGLSEKAYSYAIMAASGISNQEMSSLFSVSCDSIKSSLKRTYSSLGIKNRRGLSGIVPALK